MEQFLDSFSNIKRAYDSNPSRDPDIICKNNSSGTTLKLQKASWANPGMLNLPANIGIFFSIWLSDKGVADKQIHYNIHALKLRHLESYSIASVDFAKQFRREFERFSDSFPNVSVEHGPLTLMQGWIELDIATIEQDVTVLIDKLIPLSDIIDKMLAERKRVAKRGALAAV